jgi:hypothetical protein
MKDLVDASPATLVMLLCIVISVFFMGFLLLPPHLRKIKRCLRNSKRSTQARQRS